MQDWLRLFQIRPAQPGDGDRLAEQLRPADRAELAATHPGVAPKVCLEKFIEISSVSLYVSYQDRPLLLAGIYRDPKLISPCIVWMLTGQEVNHHPVGFVKIVKFFLNQWQSYYGELFNYIDARYSAACKLAKLLGARVEDDGTYYRGKLFLKCIFRRNLWEE